MGKYLLMYALKQVKDYHAQYFYIENNETLLNANLDLMFSMLLNDSEIKEFNSFPFLRLSLLRYINCIYNEYITWNLSRMSNFSLNCHYKRMRNILIGLIAFNKKEYHGYLDIHKEKFQELYAKIICELNAREK